VILFSNGIYELCEWNLRQDWGELGFSIRSGVWVVDFVSVFGGADSLIDWLA